MINKKELDEIILRISKCFTRYYAHNEFTLSERLLFDSIQEYILNASYEEIKTYLCDKND